MKTSFNALLLTAALSGLVGGTALSAQTAANGGTRIVPANAGTMMAQNQAAPAKHACKGQNACKGQGGCKTSDQGCKAKNSCKGKGGCATDGSKPPKAV